MHYYVALAELGLGDKASAEHHARRTRELGYPEVVLRSAPQLREIRGSMSQYRLKENGKLTFKNASEEEVLVVTPKFGSPFVDKDR